MRTKNVSRATRGRFSTVGVKNTKETRVFSGKVMNESPHYVTFHDSSNHSTRTYNRASVKRMKSGATLVH